MMLMPVQQNSFTHLRVLLVPIDRGSIFNKITLFRCRRSLGRCHRLCCCGLLNQTQQPQFKASLAEDDELLTSPDTRHQLAEGDKNYWNPLFLVREE
jgi:hypothetical protein